MKSGIKYICVLCAIFLLYFPAYAQSTYSVKHLIERALDLYELYKIEKLKIDEVDALRKYETQWKNPEISMYYGNKTIDSQKGTVTGISILQPLYFPGKLSLVDEIYRYKKNYQLLSHEEMKFIIASSVVNLAYEYAISLQKSSHINTRIKRLKLINTYMTARPIVSPQKRVETAIVKNTIRKLESEIYKIKADQDIARQCLALYTRLNVPELKLSVQWIEKAPLFDVNELVHKAKTDSLLVKKQKELVLASAKELALAQKNVYPDIAILFNYDYEKVTEKERTLSGGISIPIPLYNQNQNQIDAVAAKAKQEQQMMEYVERLVESDIKTIISHYDYYKNMLSLYHPSIEDELEKSMYYADNEFQKGTITFQSYLELDVQIHETFENIYTTQRELVHTLAAIACITNDYTLLMELAE